MGFILFEAKHLSDNKSYNYWQGTRLDCAETSASGESKPNACAEVTLYFLI